MYDCVCVCTFTVCSYVFIYLWIVCVADIPGVILHLFKVFLNMYEIAFPHDIVLNIFKMYVGNVCVCMEGCLGKKREVFLFTDC